METYQANFLRAFFCPGFFLSTTRLSRVNRPALGDYTKKEEKLESMSMGWAKERRLTRWNNSGLK